LQWMSLHMLLGGDNQNIYIYSKGMFHILLEIFIMVLLVKPGNFAFSSGNCDCSSQ
jgi:hypothetical protein